MNKDAVIKYDKLVRDNIPKIIISSGKECVIRQAKGEELYQYRKNKVLEELEEVKEVLNQDEVNSDKLFEELADLLEAYSWFMYGEDLGKSTLNNVFDIVIDKREARGSFKDNIILDMVIDLGEENE